MPEGRIEYVRGASVDFDRRQAIRVVVALWFVALVILLVVLVVSAVGQSSRTSRLQSHGVAVNVTVTSCFGVASGTGETFTGYSCRGRFTLDGQHHSGVISGVTRSYREGATVRALTDPANPSTLATPRSVGSAPSSWEGYIAPAVVALMLIVSAGLVVWRRRREVVVSDPAPVDPDSDPVVGSAPAVTPGRSSSAR